MLRRLIKVSAVMLGAGLVVTGCSPVKLGAAAIVGDQRITIATLDTAVADLSQAAKQYPANISLTQAQETQQALGWLVRFQVVEQLARQQGITVSAAQAQTALAQIVAAAKAQAQASGVSNVTLTLILAANGIPPSLSAEVGRYQAIQTRYVERANGGQLPTTTAGQTASSAKLAKAQCVAAKSLKISVNPQFGRLDYSQLSVVAAASTVTRAAGPAKAASSAGLTPAC